MDERDRERTFLVTADAKIALIQAALLRQAVDLLVPEPA